MKISWVIKANFLILSLVLVFYIMFQVKLSGLPPAMLSLLGLHSPATHSDKYLTWCETRVQSMEKPRGFKIYQDKLKWFIHSRQEVDFISVEKWLGQNCSLKIKPLTQCDFNLGDFQTVLVVNFIKGVTERLLKREPDIYAWKGQVFRSPQLEAALNQLESFPKADVKK